MGLSSKITTTSSGFTVPQSLLFFRFVKDNREDNDEELIKK